MQRSGIRQKWPDTEAVQLRFGIRPNFEWLDTGAAKNGRIPRLPRYPAAGYRGLSVYVCLFVFLLAQVSSQEIWPDTKFD